MHVRIRLERERREALQNEALREGEFDRRAGCEGNFNRILANVVFEQQILVA